MALCPLRDKPIFLSFRINISRGCYFANIPFFPSLPSDVRVGSLRRWMKLDGLSVAEAYWQLSHKSEIARQTLFPRLPVCFYGHFFWTSAPYLTGFSFVWVCHEMEYKNFRWPSRVLSHTCRIQKHRRGGQKTGWKDRAKIKAIKNKWTPIYYSGNVQRSKEKDQRGVTEREARSLRAFFLLLLSLELNYSFAFARCGSRAKCSEQDSESSLQEIHTL